MIDVGLLGALLGGVLALVSPCSAMLLPSFFAYSFDRSGLLVRRTAVFYLGMLVVLVPLGAGVGAIGSLLTRYRTTVTTVGGVVMIVLGIAMIAGLGFRFGAADRLASRITVSSGLSVFLLGTVYALAGFCSGPVLGSVLTVAAVGSQPAYGGLLMAFYALGMVLPLFVLALVWERFDLRSKRWVRGTEIRIGPLRTHTTNLISGVLFIAIGVLFVATEGTASLIGITTSDTQFDLQEWTQQVTSHVSNPIFLLVIAVVALAVVLYRLARPAAGTEAAGAEETGAAQDAKEADDVDAVDAQGR
ncbi:cytochrome c biogenesis CcdA family protein [Tsukamurella pulmonis]|uniref:cytochrome c biogenesis CcdA family protein n=1 Tax=Tsukamurella pulmonis TaxID=47312 RepID=UPI000E08F2B6|nr:cytochrome c biogenesis CcdA family protein [Tsukamurella pulmonis]RDH12943.1 cytochrome c biogenesis protein CcdA [Tsukamurella pulmonis]